MADQTWVLLRPSPSHLSVGKTLGSRGGQARPPLHFFRAPAAPGPQASAAAGRGQRRWPFPVAPGSETRQTSDTPDTFPASGNVKP